VIDQIGDTVQRRASPRPRRSQSEATAEQLVAVETRTDVQRPVMAQPEPARRSSPRPRKVQAVSNEPLVFVETRKGDQ
jgi:hypothetical protein